MTSSPDRHDRLTSELLHSLQHSSLSTPAEKQAAILDEVLAHYDDTKTASRGESTLVQLEDHPLHTRHRPIRDRWLTAAAALVVATLGVSLLLRGGSGSVQLDTTDEPLVESTTDLEPTTDLIALFDGLISLDPGELQLDTDGNVALLFREVNPSSRIIIVPLGERRFSERFTQLQLDGFINNSTNFSSTRVDGEPTLQWAVGISERGADQLGCTINEICLDVIDGVAATGISSGTPMTVTEVITSDGSSVLFMIDSNGPLRDELARVLSTVVVS